MAESQTDAQQQAATSAMEQHNLQSSAAYQQLHELEQEGKITPEKCELYKQKFFELHRIMMKNMETETLLTKKARNLTKQLNNENLKLEKAQQQQKEHEYKLKALEEKLEQVKKETAEVDASVASLSTELQKKQNDYTDQKNEYAQQEHEKREMLIPVIKDMNAAISVTKMEIKMGSEILDKQDAEAAQLEAEIAEAEKHYKQMQEQIEGLQLDYMKEKDEPARLEKGNANIQKSVDHMENEKRKSSEEVSATEAVLKKLKDQVQTISDTVETLKKDRTIKKGDLLKLQQEIDELSHEIKVNQEKDAQLVGLNAELGQDIKAKQMMRRSRQDDIKKLKKEINKEHKEFKKKEHEDEAIMEQYKGLLTLNSATQKFMDELLRDREKYQTTFNNLMEEQQIFCGQLVKKGLEDKGVQAKVLALKNSISTFESQVQSYNLAESKFTEEIKFLSTIREKMARTASQASALARETKEELKVKELLILDLTKKQQEVEFRFNQFVALYEEVKNARNKYVSQIQNSSQDLAEMKERIKILQNEVEILRNESAEKDRALVDIKHLVQKETYLRDKKRAELNKKEYQFRNKQSTIGQKIQESDKLNLIINSLQKEMNNLIYEYEQACESRNYMGIQLIDRNDELCILYEKSNIQENILKTGEQKIREKEEKIKMIELELKDRQRQLRVVHGNIPLVPKYSGQLISLKKQVDDTKSSVEQLSRYLEDPECTDMRKRRDLEGEDPDQEALNAKIQVLEERLNNKKEALLEKELVYEEVSNLAEKLRTQALEGRKTTLEIAEKINEYKARTSDLSNKMLASVSELSMFQSKALKLEQEKEEKQAVLDQAESNLSQQMPPTEDVDVMWNRIERTEARKEMEREERLQRKLIESQLPTNGVKSSALPRPNSYMPPDIQIPRPYGVFAPFKPSDPGAQMRHIVKPKPQEIEL